MSSLSFEKNRMSQEENLDAKSTKVYSTECIDNYNINTIVKPRKVIAKTKANIRKGYKKKQIEIVPIITLQLFSQSRYLLYGQIDVESYYKDYPSPYEMDLVDWSNAKIGVFSVEKSTTNMDITINYFTKSSSGIRDFQFLIDHFDTIPDQQYRELANNLKQYQIRANNTIQNISDLSTKLKQRLISYEEVQEAQQRYQNAFEDFVKSQVREEDFYITTYGALNLDFFEVETKYTKISLALLSLLGIEPRNFEISLLRDQQPYIEQFGIKRLKQALRILNICVSDYEELQLDQECYTADCIPFYCQIQAKGFVWKERPSWMSDEFCDCALVKFNVSLQQLQAILEIRSSMSNKKQLEYGMLDDDYNFEYTVESEIFIEKFYPKVFHDKINKKSLQLKQDIMQSSNGFNSNSKQISENETQN
ncbi:hypothetical protein ABPG74_014163 [Tetrahymena malaccensis]